MTAANHPSVVVLDGPETGAVLSIDEILADFSIGSDEGCHLQLSGESVSPVHVGFFLDDEGRVTLSDSKSLGGVFVNGTRVVEQALSDGDEISLGDPGDPSSRRLRFVAIGSELDVASENLISLDTIEPLDEGAESALADLAAPDAMPSFNTSETLAPAETSGEMPESAEPPAVVTEHKAPVASGLPGPRRGTPPPRRGAGASGATSSDGDPLSGLAESLGGARSKGFVPPPPVEPQAQKAAPKKVGPSKAAMASRIAAIALILAVGAWYGTKKYRQSVVTPVVDTYLPGLAEPGMTMTINGSGFGEDASAVKVTLGGLDARVLDAIDTRINVMIPDSLSAQGSQTVPLKVVLPDKTSTSRLLKISVVPKVNSLTPKVGLPGDEVVLAGKWLANPKMKTAVTVAGSDAEIVESGPTVIRFKIPQMTATEGQKLPVRVAVGSDFSKDATLMNGHLPFVESLTPEKVLPGALVTVSGAGFNAADVDVKVGNKSAVVLSSSDTELKISAPGGRLSESGGMRPVVVQIGEKSSTPRQLEVHRDSAALYVPRFFAEGLPGGRVAVSCEIGPLMVLGSDPQSRTRAHEAAERLNALTTPGRSSRLTFVSNDTAIASSGAGPGAPPILVVAPGDAAGAPRAIASLWAAELSDMFDVFLQSRRPSRTLDMSPDGKVFVDIFGGARRRSSDPGVPQGLLVSPDPAWQKSLATLASAPVFSSSQANYILDGYWSGSIETKNTPPRKVEVSLSATPSGLFGQKTSRQGKLSTDVTLQGLSYSNRTLHFSFNDLGDTLTFSGKVDGDIIDGTVTKGGAVLGHLVLKLSR